jgi:L-asparaginase II
MQTPNPVLVENIRGDWVENRHRGSAVIVDQKGRVFVEWGDIEAPVFARSSIKLLQTIALFESGAVKKYGITPEEIVLACASHTGEDVHVDTVAKWLGQLGLALGNLNCGVVRPSNRKAHEAILCSHSQPTALHNPCSGKHAGFLSVALAKGYSAQGYTDPDHPVQKYILSILEDMMQVDATKMPQALDGCNVPALAFPLRNIALGMARFGEQATGVSKERRQVMKEICRSIKDHPILIAGTGRFDTAVIESTQGQVITKVGADAVYAATIPQKGLGIALKIDDGSIRAAEVAMGAVLNSLGVLEPMAQARLSSFLHPIVRNIDGKDTGVIRSHSGWL